MPFCMTALTELQSEPHECSAAWGAIEWHATQQSALIEQLDIKVLTLYLCLEHLLVVDQPAACLKVLSAIGHGVLSSYNIQPQPVVTIQTAQLDIGQVGLSSVATCT